MQTGLLRLEIAAGAKPGKGKAAAGYDVGARENAVDVLRVIPARRWRRDEVFDDAGRHVEIAAMAFQAQLDVKDPRPRIIDDLFDQS